MGIGCGPSWRLGRDWQRCVQDETKSPNFQDDENGTIADGIEVQILPKSLRTLLLNWTVPMAVDFLHDPADRVIDLFLCVEPAYAEADGAQRDLVGDSESAEDVGSGF